MNTVNVQYERDVGIKHKITTIIVRTAEPDPYDTVFGPGDCGELLTQFRGEWIANQQEFLVDEHPYTFFYFSDRIDGVSKRRLGVKMDLRGEWINGKDWWISADRR